MAEQQIDPYPSQLERFAALGQALQGSPNLEETMQLVANLAAELLKTKQVSIRLFDLNQNKLIAVCRVGEAMHFEASKAFDKKQGLIGWVAENAAIIRSGNAETDRRYVRRPDQKAPLTSFLGVPLIAGKRAMGVISAVDERIDYFTQHHEDLLVLLASICAPRIEMERLARLSTLDHLTGALNRRGMEALIPSTRPLTEMAVSYLSAAALEIDQSQKLRDSHGKALSDGVLRHVVRSLSAMLPSQYPIVRYGGDEFLVFFPGVPIDSAERIAQRMKECIANAELALSGIAIRVTASLGVATLEPDETREELIARCYAALQVARELGQNNIFLSR